eukprot:2994683-Pyramimonas_sp.AAC.2
MGGQAMERDLSRVELGEGSTKVALAPAGKANCDPAQALNTSANALLAGRGRRAGCAPQPPSFSAPPRQAVGRGTKRRGWRARPWIAGRRLQLIRTVPNRRADRSAGERSQRTPSTHPNLGQSSGPVGDIDVRAREKAQQGR